MKLIACDKCKSVIPLTFKKQVCKCGRIAGKYNEDGLSGCMWYKGFFLMRGARMVAVDTHLIRGWKKKSIDYVFDWKNSGLTIYHNGVLKKKTPDDYAQTNLKAFLNTAEVCAKAIKDKGILKLIKEAKKKAIAHDRKSRKSN